MWEYQALQKRESFLFMLKILFHIVRAGFNIKQVIIQYNTNSNTSFIQVRICFLLREVRIPLLNLNELGEKSQVTIILVKFVKNHKLSMLSYSFWKMFFIDQNLRYICMTYSLLELLISFWLTLVDIYCLESIFDISYQRNMVMHVNTNSKENQPIMK